MSVCCFATIARRSPDASRCFWKRWYLSGFSVGWQCGKAQSSSDFAWGWGALHLQMLYLPRYVFTLISTTNQLENVSRRACSIKIVELSKRRLGSLSVQAPASELPPTRTPCITALSFWTSRAITPPFSHIIQEPTPAPRSRLNRPQCKEPRKPRNNSIWGYRVTPGIPDKKKQMQAPQQNPQFNSAREREKRRYKKLQPAARKEKMNMSKKNPPSPLPY